MCDISLAFKPCDSNALCGISVCFRTLSPSHRQIAHALLTRPPLIGSRSSVTVRLECVKHAASVHPEPGSNSLKNGILNSSLDELKIFSSELVWLVYFFEYALRLVKDEAFLFKRISRFALACFACTLSPVVQLSMIFAKFPSL